MGSDKKISIQFRADGAFLGLKRPFSLRFETLDLGNRRRQRIPQATELNHFIKPIEKIYTRFTIQ